MWWVFLLVLVVVLLSGWLFSGVCEIGMDVWGVYECFGKLVVVFGFGLYLGLFWLLGWVLVVENGVVYELVISVVVGDGGVELFVFVEGLVLDSVNCLWDVFYVSEKL